MSAALTSETDALRRQIANLQQRIGTLTAPLAGETAIQYRRRLLGHFQKHSPNFRNMRPELVDITALDGIEQQVYADAAAHATDPANFKPGELRAIKERDASGREITKWVGDPDGWMRFFKTGAQVGHINQAMADEARP